MTTKYKAGDIVEVRLNGHTAMRFNDGLACGITPDEIIDFHPVPEPVVRWVNVYYDGSVSALYKHRVSADQMKEYKRTCVLRLEWDDGNMSKKPTSVTVEDV